MKRATGRSFRKRSGQSSRLFSAIAIQLPTYLKWRVDFTSAIASGLLADVDYEPSALRPRRSPISGKELDMSLCYLRSVSPIHLQYLKNMGVAATLVVSLMVGGRLWGLVSCHHYSPRVFISKSRSVCELLAEVIGTRIAALESFMRGQGELAARRLEQRMTEWISRDGDWRGALFDRTRPLLLPLVGGRRGAHIRRRDPDDWRRAGNRRNPRHRALGRPQAGSGAVLDGESRRRRTALRAPGRCRERCCCVPDFGPGRRNVDLVPKRTRTDRDLGWKSFQIAVLRRRPLGAFARRSFAQWHQIVKGTSDPWTVADLSAARLIGSSVTDVVVQFRAVRILIAQDQLEQVLRQVRGSDQQVVVADARGLILESNAAFGEWLGIDDGALRSLNELPNFFADPDHVGRRLKALIGDNKPWRGEAVVCAAEGRTTTVLVRADPVFVAPERVLGFVLLFADLTDRKAAESARRRFHDGILRSNRKVSAPVESPRDMAVQTLMSSVIENAQLAALEITDATDISEAPALLESVRKSVSRTAVVLDQLAHVVARRRAKGTRLDRVRLLSVVGQSAHALAIARCDGYRARTNACPRGVRGGDGRDDRGP